MSACPSCTKPAQRAGAAGGTVSITQATPAQSWDLQHPGFESADLAWYLRFFRDPPWRWAAKTALALWRYRELYRPLVRGEATASYAAMERDVIAEILKKHGPLSREEIVEKVMRERYVKPNTILVNLQNQKYFKKNKEGRYVTA